MPSLRADLDLSSIQLPKAPSAQIVMICHSPPSFSGARRRPYFRSGGAMLICHRFQVGPSAAPYRIIATPRKVKKIVVTPKKPT